MFNKNTGIIDVIQVSALEKYKLYKKETVSLNKINEEGTIRLLESKNFSFEGFFNPFYLLNQDILLFVDEEVLSSSYDCILIDRDFGFIIKNKTVIGFFIENSSLKTNIEKVDKYTIYKILSYYTEDSIELMEDKSSLIKTDLIELYETEPNIKMQEIFANLLDVYYNFKINLLEKNVKEAIIYKTYQGKDYTQEEWKVFEEEEYRKYVEKRSGKKSSFLADEEIGKQNFNAESATLKEVKYFVMNTRQDKVPVYEFPSAMFAPFTFLENKTAVDVIKYEQNGWCEILSKEKKKAYIQSNHVKKND